MRPDQIYDLSSIVLGEGRTIFLASDNTLHSVPSQYLWQAYDIDPSLAVLADSPEEWRAFVQGQLRVEEQWSKRHILTADDQGMLSDMGIAWEPSNAQDSTSA